VNAGIRLEEHGTGTWAMLTASLAGRPLGILGALAVGLALGLHLPKGIGWRELIVIGLTASAGFTFPLLFATDVLAIGPILGEVKQGALLSVIAAFLAFGFARVLGVGRWARRGH
jgi:Na+/H+ antiporter NhaA